MKKHFDIQLNDKSFKSLFNGIVNSIPNQRRIMIEIEDNNVIKRQIEFIKGKPLIAKYDKYSFKHNDLKGSERAEITSIEFEQNWFIANKLTTIGEDTTENVEFISTPPSNLINQDENRRIYSLMKDKKDKFNDWSSFDWINEIRGDKDLKIILNEPKALIYIVANWCGQERIGRNKIFKAVESLKERNFNLFIMDTSDEQPRYFPNWLNQYSDKADKLFFRGYSELLLFKNGKFIDYITYAFNMNQNEILKNLKQWNATTNT